MQIAHRFAGFTLAKADTLRKAMGKKQADKMAQLEEDFVRGARERSIDAKTAGAIFSDMARFAEYGFNKSHSAAYALIAYRTAYLKTNYPREYMAALLNSEMSDMDKLAFYMGECREMGIEVLPPDVNESFSSFTVVQDRIRFGLSAIKNVGQGAVESVIKARAEGGPYRSLFDFLERVENSCLNKRVVESMIRCGALDSLPGNRAQKLKVLDAALDAAAAARRDRQQGQRTLFEDLTSQPGLDGLISFPEVEESGPAELLAAEKELLGMYVTGHPLEKYSRLMNVLVTAPLRELDRFKPDTRVRIGGLIVKAEERISRKTGKPFGIYRIEDMDAAADLLVSGHELARLRPHLSDGSIVVVEGRLRGGELGPSLFVAEVRPIGEALEMLSSGIHLDVSLEVCGEEILSELDRLLAAHPGACPVFLEIALPAGGKVTVRAGGRRAVTCSAELIAAIERLLGPGSVKA